MLRALEEVTITTQRRGENACSAMIVLKQPLEQGQQFAAFNDLDRSVFEQSNLETNQVVTGNGWLCCKTFKDRASSIILTATPKFEMTNLYLTLMSLFSTPRSLSFT